MINASAKGGCGVGVGWEWGATSGLDVNGGIRERVNFLHTSSITPQCVCGRVELRSTHTQQYKKVSQSCRGS